MKRSIHPIILGTLIAGLSLVGSVSPAFASSRHVSSANTPSRITMTSEHHGFHPHGWLVHNQYFHGNSFSGLHLTFHGHNQLNTGNQGYNRGYNRNFAANGANLVVNNGRSRFERTNQYFEGNSYSNSDLNLYGYNQNNTGNQGWNDGLNEDHGANGGNQIIN